MRDIPKLPAAERDIMLSVWKLEPPVKILGIYNEMKNTRPCSKPAIHSLLERLAEKNFVRIELVDGANPYKVITPLVGEEEYRAAESKAFVEKLCHGRWQTLLAALIDTREIRPEDLDEISEMLKAKKEEHDD